MAFFHANDGRHAYFVSARDLEHAVEILRDARVELHDPNGVLRPVDHPDVRHPTMWMEIDRLRATRLVLHGTTDPLVKLREGRWVRVSSTRT